MFKVIIVCLSFLVTACSMQAPPYQVSIENVQTIKTNKIQKIKVGDVVSSNELNKISMRGSKMVSPVNKSYGAYLAKALEEELKLAKAWSAISDTVITGEFLTNDIDVTGVSKGIGVASVKFKVTRDNKEVFEKIISVNHTFESSFIGAIAIPNGQASYVHLVQKLIKKLFEDEDFISVLKVETP